MQIFFSWAKCPLLQWRLSLVHKLLYTNGTYAYFATIATSVVFTLVPFVSLVFGLHPVAFSKQFAIAATVYLPMNYAVQNFARERAHLRGQWLASVSNQLLCFTYIKAVVNTLLSNAGVKAKAGFKATEKAGGGGAKAKAQAVAAAMARAGSGVAAVMSRAGSGAVGRAGAGSGGGGQQPVLAAAAQQQQRLADDYRRRVLLAREQGLAPPPPPPGLAGARPGGAPPPGVTMGPLGPVRLENKKKAKKGAAGKAAAGAAGASSGGGASADDDDDADAEGCWAWTNAKTLQGALDPLWLALSLGVSVAAIAAGATSLARSGSLTGYTVKSWREFAELFSSGRLGVYTLVPMLWAAYNAVPPVLFFLYFFTKGRLLRGTAIVCQGLTFVFGAGESFLLSFFSLLALVSLRARRFLEKEREGMRRRYISVLARPFTNICQHTRPPKAPYVPAAPPPPPSLHYVTPTATQQPPDGQQTISLFPSKHAWPARLPPPRLAPPFFVARNTLLLLFFFFRLALLLSLPPHLQTHRRHWMPLALALGRPAVYGRIKGEGGARATQRQQAGERGRAQRDERHVRFFPGSLFSLCLPSCSKQQQQPPPTKRSRSTVKRQQQQHPCFYSLPRKNK